MRWVAASLRSRYTVTLGRSRSGSLKPRNAGSRFRRSSHSSTTSDIATTTRGSRKRPVSERSKSTASPGVIGLLYGRSLVTASYMSATAAMRAWMETSSSRRPRG